MITDILKALEVVPFFHMDHIFNEVLGFCGAPCEECGKNTLFYEQVYIPLHRLKMMGYDMKEKFLCVGCRTDDVLEEMLFIFAQDASIYGIDGLLTYDSGLVQINTNKLILSGYIAPLHPVRKGSLLLWSVIDLKQFIDEIYIYYNGKQYILTPEYELDEEYIDNIGHAFVCEYKLTQQDEEQTLTYY